MQGHTHTFRRAISVVLLILCCTIAFATQEKGAVAERRISSIAYNAALDATIAVELLEKPQSGLRHSAVIQRGRGGATPIETEIVGSARFAAVSSDGRRIAALRTAGELDLIDVSQPQLARAIKLPTADVSFVSFFGSESSIFVVSSGRCWRAEWDRPTFQIAHDGSSFICSGAVLSGNEIVLGLQANVNNIVLIEKDRKRTTTQSSAPAIGAIACSKKKSIFVTSSVGVMVNYDSAICCWDFSTMTMMWKYDLGKAVATNIIIDDKCGYVIAQLQHPKCVLEPEFVLLDARSGVVVPLPDRLAQFHSVNAACLTERAGELAIATTDGDIQFVSLTVERGCH